MRSSEPVFKDKILRRMISIERIKGIAEPTPLLRDKEMQARGAGVMGVGRKGWRREGDADKTTS